MASRTIIVGDVHGCADELSRLLDHVGLSGGDRLVLVGDLVARGPKPRATLERIREAGGRAVRGNHEDKLLRWKASQRVKAKAKATGKAGGGPAPLALGPTHEQTARELRKRDWAFLAALPLWLDLPEHGVRVVHAGVVPGLAIEATDPRALFGMRYVDPSGAPVSRGGEGCVLWGAVYEGPPHVVFGHNAQPEAQIHPFATGIDTGCVYGGRLTAMVLREGEAVPPPEERRAALVSVPAKKAYVRS